MASMEFKAKFNAHGFVPGVDISEKDWQLMISEYAALHDQFANMSNQVLDKINDTWNRYQHIKKLDEIAGECVSTFLTQMTMGIDEDTTYADWIERWYKEICEAVDQCATMAGFRVRSNLFRDGDIVLFGGKFKDKPEWTIDVSLEPVG